VLTNSRLIITALILLITVPAVAWCSEPSSVNSLVAQLENYAAQSTNQLAILIAIALATLVSEDLACITAGLLAAKSIISIPAAVTASALGIYFGDILLYLTGDSRWGILSILVLFLIGAYFLSRVEIEEI